MTAVKTQLGAVDEARAVPFQPTSVIAATDVQEAIEAVEAIASAAAPGDAVYIVGSSHAELSAERVATDTATIDVDLGTAGQAKWNIITDSVDNTFLANMAQATLKGRASGAGTGDPTDLTEAQTKTILGFPISTTDNTVPRFDGTGGNLQTSGVTIGDTDIVGGVAAIGVGGATADTTNRISSNSDAVLFNHAGTTSQVKVNKNATANTASHLFQVGFSGRAEFGLIGSDDFQMKTSPDGSAFTTGLTILNSSAALRVHVNISPSANDGAALGTTALGWADLHFASGGVVNWANSLFTAAHGSGIGGANSLVLTSADAFGGLRAVSTSAGADGPLVGLYHNSASPAQFDQFGFLSFSANDSGGTETYYADIYAYGVNVTNTTEQGALAFGLTASGAYSERLVLFASALSPWVDDTLTLGEPTFAWSDFYLASGAVVDFGNANYTVTHSSDNLAFSGSATHAAGKKVTIGHTAPIAGLFSETPSLQVLGTDGPTSSMLLARYQADGSAPNVTFAKSRNASIGSHTVVQSGDVLGFLTFGGDDGDQFIEGARISAVVDGTPGNNDMPTRLVFSTTADGGSTVNEGFRLSANGVVNFINRPTGVQESFIIACSDEATNLTTGTNKVKFRMPYAFTVTAVRASLSTAQTAGSIFTVDINESGTTILSTKLTIDNNETTSTTAATPAVISDTSLADDAEISIDIDQVGTAGAKGLKVTIIGYRP